MKFIYIQVLLIYVGMQLCSMPAYSEEQWQRTSFIVQAFEEIALRSEYVAGEQVVRKWTKPVKVWLEHHVDQKEQHAQLTQYHLQNLSRISGHRIDLVNTPTEANMIIIFTDSQRWYQEVMQISGNSATKPPDGAICMFGITLDAQKAIRHAWVVIPVDHAQEHRSLLSCIVEETTQAMGLPNDSEQVFPSIFNDKTPEALLTGLDAVLLKLLYHPAVKTGMRAAQVKPILTQIIQQWQGDGTIANAEKDVRRSELYEMMGF